MRAEIKFKNKKSILYKKAQKLLKAAFEYWEEMQKQCPQAVIWVTDEAGKTVFFTRGEYTQKMKDSIREF